MRIVTVDKVDDQLQPSDVITRVASRVNPFIEIETHREEYWLRLKATLPNGQAWEGFATVRRWPILFPVSFWMRRAKRKLLKQFALMSEISSPEREARA